MIKSLTQTFFSAWKYFVCIETLCSRWHCSFGFPPGKSTTFFSSRSLDTFDVVIPACQILSAPRQAWSYARENRGVVAGTPWWVLQSPWQTWRCLVSYWRPRCPSVWSCLWLWSRVCCNNSSGAKTFSYLLADLKRAGNSESFQYRDTRQTFPRINFFWFNNRFFWEIFESWFFSCLWKFKIIYRIFISTFVKKLNKCVYCKSMIHSLPYTASSQWKWHLVGQKSKAMPHIP